MKCGHDICPNKARMRRVKNYFILFLFLLVPAVVFSQTPQGGNHINLKHANTLKGDQRHGYQRLIGEVEFEQQGMILTCDSAHLFTVGDSVIAFSHVHIQQGDSINVFGDFLHYDGTTRKANLTKNVKLIDKDMTLTTDTVVYDLTEKIASYSSGGKIVNKQNTLTSKIGAYSTETKVLTFKKNVVLVNPEYVMKCDTLKYLPLSKTSYFLGPTTIKATNNSNLIYCENGFYDTNKDECQFEKNAYIITEDKTLKGDSIWYNRNMGLGKAFMNVEIIDTTQNMIIRGDYAVHNEITDVSLVTGHALFINAFEGDSLFLHADTLKSITLHDSTETKIKPKGKNKIKVIPDSLKTPPKRIVLAYHNVRFYKKDLQGKCDSLAWTSVDSTMRMYNDPVLWSGGNQLTADNISIITSHGEIYQLKMVKNAFIISREDSSRFNQIKGKQMTGYFQNNELYKIFVEGNGQTLYYAKDKDLIMGVNRADCSSLLIRINNKEVTSITFYNHPEATLYPPLDISPKESLLKDFRWRDTEQPHSVKDLFLK
jgi:lipopolysaccharide export system protein LptA